MVLIACAGPLPCTAEVATWTGSGTAQAPTAGAFSIPGNWAGDVLPAFDGTTDLIFDVGSSAYTVTNDLGSLRINSAQITSDGSGSTELWLTGGSFSFEAAGAEAPQLNVSSTGTAVRLGANLTLGADLTLLRPIGGSDQFLYIGSGISGGNIDLSSHRLLVTRPFDFLGSDADRVRIGESGSSTRGVISGTGKIVLEDLAIAPSSSGLTLHLSSRSTYSGGTEVRSGHLALNGDSVVLNGALQSGPLGTGPVTMKGGFLRSTVSRRTLHNMLIVDGSFSLGGYGFQGIIAAGPIRLDGNYAISVPANAIGSEQGIVEVSGRISEVTSGTGLTWNLDQPLTLTSLCSYTGPTVVRGNVLQLLGPGRLGVSPLTLTSGGGLSGDGDTGSVTAESGTTVSPGGGVGVLRTYGAASLKAGARLALELNSSVPLFGYDQWAVQGTVDVSGADLQIALGYDPADLTDVFYVVVNDGGDAVIGFFDSLGGTPADLTEGARFSVASQEFEITYTAEEGVGFTGAGNDIAIRALPEPSALALVGLCGLGLVGRRHRRK